MCVISVLVLLLRVCGYYGIISAFYQNPHEVYDFTTPGSISRGKKKLEKALYQSQQDVMNLTEKLVGLQSDLEDTRNNLDNLGKQLENKEAYIERLKLQVNTNKSFATECDDLRKALEAKEQQLQNYIVQMDEVELALSQAEGKNDNYVGSNKKLKEENQKLLEEIEKKSKEHQQIMIETRRELEQKYDNQVKEIKNSHEEVVTTLKDVHEEEIKSLRDKIDQMRNSSSTSNVTTPASQGSLVTTHSRVTTAMEYSSSSIKRAARVVKTVTDLKGSTRLDTASSQVSITQDSALESSSLFVSVSNTPSTPKTAEILNLDTRDVSATKNTTEISVQTETISGDLSFVDDESDGKSKHELEEIERELSTTPSEHLSQKIEEYKNKVQQVQQEHEEQLQQWKIRFNTKSLALDQLFTLHQNEMKEKQRILEELSLVQEQQAQAEKEAEDAIIQLEELRAENEKLIPADDVLTENRSTLTSASLLRPTQDEEVKKEDRLQSPGDLVQRQSVAVQYPSAKRKMLSPHYSDVSATDEVEGVIIQTSDSGFEENSHVSPPKTPDLIPQNEEQDNSKRSRSPSPSVRSRLLRSALKEHRVISETIKTFEMVTEFKINITYWLEHNGFKSDLFHEIPEVSIDKSDELDVLNKIPLIRDQAKQLLDALWEVTAGEYSVVTNNNGNEDNHDEETRVNSVCDVYDVDVIASEDGGLSSSPVAQGQRTPEAKSSRVTSSQHLRARSVQTSRLLDRSPRTTPKGYTQLLHEYNNLNEKYVKLEQEHQDSLKMNQQETSQNAVVMNEMKETINNLRLQLLENGAFFKQEMSSSVMFTRLDAERNVKSMKRALHGKSLSQSSFDNVVKQMSLYVDLPGIRLAELVKRYRHHCIMKEVEENLCPPTQTSEEIYNIQERMEELQKERALKWSKKMNEMSERRSKLSTEITSSLNEIEESSGIFLIKPIYSYSSRPQPVQKSTHPIICKKRPDIAKKPNSFATQHVQAGYSTNQTSNTEQTIPGKPTWNLKDSLVSGPATVYDNVTIPRLLAMDINRITLSRNPVSVLMSPKSSNDNLNLTSGVRQYITVERPVGVMNKGQLNGESAMFSPSVHQSLPITCRTPSPSLSHYATLPPINLPNMENQHASATSHTTHQSVSSLSMTSFDESFSKFSVPR